MNQVGIQVVETVSEELLRIHLLNSSTLYALKVRSPTVHSETNLRSRPLAPFEATARSRAPVRSTRTRTPTARTPWVPQAPWRLTEDQQRGLERPAQRGRNHHLRRHGAISRDRGAGVGLRPVDSDRVDR